MWYLLVLLFAASVQASHVLVLGSGGLIGTGLTGWLRQNGYPVAEVRNRLHVDLRIPGAIDRALQEQSLTASDIDFVYFLACEVGGSKYIDSKASNTQLEIIESNTKMYTVVFEWVERARVPLLFTSSYAQFQETAYGSIKRLGEGWVRALPPRSDSISSQVAGKSVRLWNIYGPEKIGPRSHVLGDWINSCLTNGTINSLTDGTEFRQFMHVDDVARALGWMMETYPSLNQVTDLSSGIWHSMRTVGELVTQSSPVPCTISYSEKETNSRAKVDPNLTTLFHRQWQPVITLRDGIQRQFKHYAAMLQIHRDEL